MTKQEAIETIKLALSQVEWDYPLDYAAAFDIAISAMDKQDVPDTNVGNMISRQAAIDAHCELCGDRERCNCDICPDVEVFQLLPSAQPERNTGEWIKVKRCEEDTQPNLKCPFCGNIVGWFDLAKYCAGCGAKLEGGAG